jgi:arsenite methyltransferase
MTDPERLVSDILAKKPMPAALAKNVSLYVGCISGASLVEQYEKYLADAGFKGLILFQALMVLLTGCLDVLIVDKNVDLNVYKESDLFDVKNEKADGGDKDQIIDEMRPACCGTGGEKAEVKADSCCGGGTTDKELSELLKTSDFNEWVGKSLLVVQHSVLS